MRSDRGAALLLVLLLVALLAIVVVEFQRQARVDLRAAQNLQDDLQAHALLRSGSDVSEQVLAIYAKNSIADMKSGAIQVKGGELLWKFLFEEEAVAIPVPSGAIEGSASLRGRLRDLYGRFPLGALVGEGTEPKRTVFRYYLGHVKEYLSSQENKTLEGVDAEQVADAIIARLSGMQQAGASIRYLAELETAEGLSPAVVRTISPFLDVRKEWKFNANARCVPLIMTMQSKNIDEAAEIRDTLRQDPVSDDKDIPNTGVLGGISPEFANSLTTKTSRVEVVLEAEVSGGARRARAVFARGGEGQASGGEKFRLLEWSEGWVETEVQAPAVTEASEGGEEE